MAENETKQLGSRIRSGLYENAKKGKAFNPIVTGYDRGEDGRAVINEQQAIFVKRIFELKAEETSSYFINKALKKELGIDVHAKTIDGIVQNPIYKGERKYLGETIPITPIVTPELWQQANDYLKSRRKTTSKRYRKHENVVEGKIFCDNCNKVMYQMVVRRINTFKCFKCGVTVNRPWLYAMIKFVVEAHKDKVNTDKFKKRISWLILKKALRTVF